jgi:hypothetical protein
VGLPNDALVKERDQAQGHVQNRAERPSPNIKRPSSTSGVESGRVGATTKQKGKAKGSSSSVEEDAGGRDKKDSKPPLVTRSAARIGSCSPGQEAVQEHAKTLGEIPYGWTPVKLEPDC